MAYHLIQSPRLEDLITHHVSCFLGQNLFDKSQLVVVQNQQTADWLNYTIARQNNILMGFSCQLTEQAFRQLALGFSPIRIATGYDAETEKMSRPFLFDDDLQLLIYQKLQQNLDQTDLRFIQEYLAKIPSRMKDIRLWGLAHDTAQWFAQYARSSRVLMQAWRLGQSPQCPSDKETESWQRFLWFNILGGQNPTYNLLGDWLDRVMQDKLSYAGTIRRVILVGSAFLNEVYLDFLQFLSKDIEIFHFMLEPIAADQIETDRPFLLNHAEMFRQLQHYFAGYPHIKTTTPLRLPAPQSLLGQLQISLYTGHMPTSKSSPDESLRRITCSDEEREVEVLKDMLLHHLDRDPSISLNEIAILAPDINKYSAYIQAIFDRGPQNQHLAYNIIDLDDSADPAFIQASLGLMNLAGGRFSRKEIFDLLDNPLLVQRYAIQAEDRDIWLNFCEETEILLNKNSQQREQQDLGNTSLNTFDHGFLRFLLGQTFGQKDTPVGMTLARISQTTADKISRFIVIVNRLYEDFYDLGQKKMSLSSWLDVVESRLTEHLVGSGPELKSLRNTFAHLRESSSKIASLPHAKTPMSFFVLKEIISDVIRGQKRKVGRYLAHGIVCSSLIPLRALPFKIIIILGLNNGEFPRVSGKKNSDYDLLKTTELQSLIKIHGEKHHLDRYAFLETIFSARQELWFFHQDRDSITGEKLSPSSSLADLELFLSMFLCTEEELDAHQQVFPKSPFNHTLFIDGCVNHSYDAGNLELGKIRNRRQAPNTPVTRESISTGDSVEIDPAIWESAWQDSIKVEELSEFIKSPIEYFFKKILHVDESPSNQIDKTERVDVRYDLQFYKKKKLYEKIIVERLTNVEYITEESPFWQRFLNDEFAQDLKKGSLGRRIFSSRSYNDLRDDFEWISTTINEKGLGLLEGPCVLNDKENGGQFLVPVGYHLDGKEGRLYGKLPNVFVNHNKHAVHCVNLSYDKNPTIGELAVIYTSFILCRLSLPEYSFHVHIFCLKSRNYRHKQFAALDKEKEQALVGLIVRNFLLTSKVAPKISLYQEKGDEDTEKNAEHEARLLRSTQERPAYQHEKELFENLYKKFNDFNSFWL